MAVEITKEDFESFVEVQMGGLYNMFDPNAMIETGLDQSVYLAIMKEYPELSKKYPDVIQRYDR